MEFQLSLELTTLFLLLNICQDRVAGTGGAKDVGAKRVQTIKSAPFLKSFSFSQVNRKFFVKKCPFIEAKVPFFECISALFQFCTPVLFCSGAPVSRVYNIKL